MIVRGFLLYIVSGLTVCMGLTAAVHGQAEGTVDNRTVDGARQLYVQHGKKLAEKRDAEITALGAKYTTSLQTAADQAQKAGQLEPLLAMRKELERFANQGAEPPAISRNTDPALARWRETYNREYTRIQTDHDAVMANLTKSYLEHLDSMKKDLTKDGNVKEALAFMQEYERVKRDTATSAPVPEPMEPVHRAEAPTTGEPVPTLELLKTLGLDRRIISFDGDGTGGFAGPDGMSPSNLQVTHGERSRVSEEGIQFMGGRTVISGADDLLLAACQASQAITITAELTSRRPRQEGAARIISFSLGAHHRNVSLCQEGEDLVLRLRTSDTGLNGANPQVTLGTLERGQKHRLAVTYRPGDLRFFLDGKRLPVDTITGDFKNWEPCHLVLGNEWEEDRPWRGTLHKFAIYARFMTDLEGTLKTRF